MSNLFLVSGVYRVSHYMGDSEDKNFSYIVDADNVDDAVVSVAKMIEGWSSEYSTNYYVTEITSASAVVRQHIADSDREKYRHLY